MSGKKRPVVVLTEYMYQSIQPFWDVYNAAGIEFRPCQCRTAAEIIEAAKDADALQIHFASITKEIIDALPNIRIIVRSAVGMDCVELEYAKRVGLPVCNVPDYGIEDVSTHAILLILAITKKFNILTESVKKGVWDYAVAGPVHRITGQMLGLVGCGAIARCAAKKAQAFGMKVIAYDPFLSQEQVDDLGIKLVPLDEVAGRSDVVSVHVPLSEATRGMLNLDFFKQMKRSAFLINTARGGIVEEGDLVTALRTKLIAGAGLDVICDEKISPEHPLLQFDNVILTPHAAWYSEEAENTLLTSAAEEVVRGLRGERLKHPFNGIFYARTV